MAVGEPTQQREAHGCGLVGLWCVGQGRQWQDRWLPGHTCGRAAHKRRLAAASCLLLEASLCLRSFCPLPAGNFRSLAAQFDFSRYATLADIGGSLGTLSLEVGLLWSV